MKKWISLLLTLVMLCSACAALGEGEDSFAAALADWGNSLNLDTSDYGCIFSIQDVFDYKATLRKNNGIIELALDDDAILQYVDGQLIAKIGDQIIQVDVDAFIKAAQERATSLEELKEDKRSIEALFTKAVFNMISPYIISVDETGALVIHMEINEDDLKDIITKLFYSFEEDQEVIDKLLQKYGFIARLVKPGFPLTYQELKNLWRAKIENATFTLPAMHLCMDFTIALNQSGIPEVAGVTTMTTDLGEINSTFVSHQENGESKMRVDVDGDLFGKPFAESATYCQNATSLSVTYTDIRNTRTDYALTVSTVPEDFGAVLSCNADGIQNDWTLDLHGNYQQDSGDLFACLDLSSFNGIDDLIEINLANLIASIAKDRFECQLTVLGDTEFDMLAVNNTLYKRFETAVISGNEKVSSEMWIFPISENTVRFRSDVKEFTGIKCIDHIHASGVASDDSVDMNVTSTRYGKLMTMQYEQKDENKTLNMEYYLIRGDRKSENPLLLNAVLNGNDITLNSSFHGEREAFSLDFTAELNENNCPQFVNAVLILDKPGNTAESKIYQLSYVPYKLTLIDGQNYYELEKIEDSRSALIWTLTRNRTCELYRLEYTLDESGTMIQRQSGELIQPSYFSIYPLPKTDIELIDTSSPLNREQFKEDVEGLMKYADLIPEATIRDDVLFLSPDSIMEMLSSFTQMIGDLDLGAFIPEGLLGE